MKTLLKYKFALLAIIAFATDFLVDLKQTVGVNDLYLELIGSGLAILSILKKRLETEYLERTKNNKIQVKFSLIVGVVDFFIGWLSDFKKENLKASENIPSHLAIGMALINLFLLAHAPHWSLNVFACIFLGFSVGMLIEAVQVKYFEGVYSVRDIRWTINGCFLWYIIASLLNFDFGANLTMIISCVLVVFSFIAHSSFKFKV